MAESKYSIEIQVNQKSIAINAFVQNFYTHTLLGSLQALKDIPENVESLSIQIKKVQP